MTDGGSAEVTDGNVPQCVYHSVFVVQMKNCEPLVSGPELAMERVPAEIEQNEFNVMQSTRS